MLVGHSCGQLGCPAGRVVDPSTECFVDGLLCGQLGCIRTNAHPGQ